MSQDPLAAFNKFAGREVDVIESQQSFESRGKTHSYTVSKIAPHDPVIAEIKKEAARLKLGLRTFLPGEVGTTDFQPNRLNMHVEKSDDGKYRVSKGFDIG